jgi:hypothetical protein
MWEQILYWKVPRNNIDVIVWSYVIMWYENIPLFIIPENFTHFALSEYTNKKSIVSSGPMVGDNNKKIHGP